MGVVGRISARAAAMTEAQRAAFRILCSTPRERVHTHHHKPLPVRIQGKHLGEVPDGLIDEVKRLADTGASREAICRELRMGDRLYRRIRSIIAERTAVKNKRQLQGETASVTNSRYADIPTL